MINTWAVPFVLHAAFCMGSWLTFKNTIVGQRNQMGPMTAQSADKILILNMYLGLIMGTTVPVCYLNNGARAEVMGYPVEEVERTLTVWFLFSFCGFPVPRRPESFTGTHQHKPALFRNLAGREETDSWGGLSFPGLQSLVVTTLVSAYHKLKNTRSSIFK